MCNAFSYIILRLCSGYSQVILRLFSGYSQVILRLFSGYSWLFFGRQRQRRRRRGKLFKVVFLSFFCIFMPMSLTSLFLPLLFLPMPTRTTTQSVLRYFYADVVVKNKFISSIFLSAVADTDDDAECSKVLLFFFFLVFFCNCRENKY